MRALLALSLFLCAPAPAAEPLRVGLTGKYPPFNYFDTDGALTGFDVDVARALCARIGRPCDFRVLQWDGILSALLAGRIDVIIGSMAITPEREKAVRFTEPYYVSGAQLFVRAGETPDPRRAGFRIGVTLGTTYGEFARREYPEAEIRTYKGDVEALQDLKSGRLDGLITDKLVGLHMARSLGAPLAPLGELLFEERIGIPVRPADGPLLASLDGALTDLKGSGEYRAIWARYFGGSPTAAAGSWSPSRMAGLLLQALGRTLLVSAEGIGAGILLAALWAALMLLGRGRGGELVALFVDFIRATPFLVQLFALYFGLPSLGVKFSAWNAAVLAIALHSSAYLAEVFKTAYLAVPAGQRWAAHTLGLTPGETLRHVVLPQMLPLLCAPTLNTVVAMIKDSAIVSVISVHELTLQTQQLISATFRPLELYGAAALLYFAITYPLLLAGRRLEGLFKRRGLLHAG